MTAGKLSRRLDRLEAELTPRDEQVLTITVRRIGDNEHPTRTFELRGLEPQGRRRRWPRSGGR
jgi:hypothetical protein